MDDTKKGVTEMDGNFLCIQDDEIYGMVCRFAQWLYEHRQCREMRITARYRIETGFRATPLYHHCGKYSYGVLSSDSDFQEEYAKEEFARFTIPIPQFPPPPKPFIPQLPEWNLERIVEGYAMKAARRNIHSASRDEREISPITPTSNPESAGLITEDQSERFMNFAISVAEQFELEMAPCDKYREGIEGKCWHVGMYRECKECVARKTRT